MTSQNSSFTNVSHSNSLRQANEDSTLIWNWNYNYIRADANNTDKILVFNGNAGGIVSISKSP